MVWGCFAWHGSGKIVQLRGNINGDIYKRLLVHHMIPSAKQLFPVGGFCFQHDNATVHSPSNAYLDKKEFQRMVWPPQSPDLNPIENLWFVMNESMKDRAPKNDDEFFTLIREAWKKLSVEKLHNVVESMHHRCSLVIKAHGYPIDY